MPDVKIIATGGFTPTELIVNTDRSTILGSGTSQDPLRAAGGGVAWLARYTDEFEPAAVGRPVQVVEQDPLGADAAVVLAAAGTVIRRPLCAGLIVAVDGDRVRVQSSGEVGLTIAQWDLVTGGDDGLVVGAAYYVSFGSGDVGHLTTTRSSTSGTDVVLVGVALSPTRLLLSTLPAVVLPVD